MPGQRRNAKPTNPDDLLAHLDLIISCAEEAEDTKVTLPTRAARFMLELAKRAPKKGRGRKAIGGRAKATQNLMIKQARRRKADLVATGMRKEQAADQAAQEASDALGKQGQNLAASTIKRRMQRRY